MLGVQDINQNTMLHLLSNYFMKRYVLLSMTCLTGWKSHFGYAKKFLDKQSNMHLPGEKCVSDDSKAQAESCQCVSK
jgi:hypothetical protein